MKPLPPEMKADQRVLDLAYERGLIVYSRRVTRRRRGRQFHGLPAADRHARADRRDRVASSATRWRALAAELDLPVNG